jgi:hypothetical protein
MILSATSAIADENNIKIITFEGLDILHIFTIIDDQILIVPKVKRLQSLYHQITIFIKPSKVRLLLLIILLLLMCDDKNIE